MNGLLSPYSEDAAVAKSVERQARSVQENITCCGFSVECLPDFPFQRLLAALFMDFWRKLNPPDPYRFLRCESLATLLQVVGCSTTALAPKSWMSLDASSRNFPISMLFQVPLDHLAPLVACQASLCVLSA